MTTAQAIWMPTFPDRENTGDLDATRGSYGNSGKIFDIFQVSEKLFETV